MASLIDLANPTRFMRFSAALLPWLAVAAALFVAVGLYLAWFVAPADYQQGETIRIKFIHVPAAWLAMMFNSMMAVSALGTLVWRHPLADVAQKAAAPIGACFALVCLITGALWGKPMWGTYWVWDARLTSVLVLLLIYLGIVALWRVLDESEIQSSILAAIGGVIAWIFKPLGWGNWQAAVASITGLVAKENIVGTLGILYGGGDGTVYQNIGAAFTGISGFSFLVFNLLCAPCFAAIGAIKREMNNRKWTWFAIGYQCGFAYLVGLMINQFGGLFTGSVNVIGLIFAVAALALMVYMLVRPYKEATKLNATV